MRTKHEIEMENISLRKENARLLRYMRALRFRFGDVAVNEAIQGIAIQLDAEDYVNKSVVSILKALKKNE